MSSEMKTKEDGREEKSFQQEWTGDNATEKSDADAPEQGRLKPFSSPLLPKIVALSMNTATIKVQMICLNLISD